MVKFIISCYVSNLPFNNESITLKVSLILSTLLAQLPKYIKLPFYFSSDRDTSCQLGILHLGSDLQLANHLGHLWLDFRFQTKNSTNNLHRSLLWLHSDLHPQRDVDLCVEQWSHRSNCSHPRVVQHSVLSHHCLTGLLPEQGRWSQGL